MLSALTAAAEDSDLCFPNVSETANLAFYWYQLGYSTTTAFRYNKYGDCDCDCDCGRSSAGTRLPRLLWSKWKKGVSNFGIAGSPIDTLCFATEAEHLTRSVETYEGAFLSP
jgi:hypothetical protein